eukprot:SAG11_NODE_538_length_8664_cov_5.830590_6_plen_76_part_00
MVPKLVALVAKLQSLSVIRARSIAQGELKALVQRSSHPPAVFSGGTRSTTVVSAVLGIYVCTWDVTLMQISISLN